MFPGRIDAIAAGLNDSDSDSDSELKKILNTPPRAAPVYQPMGIWQQAPGSVPRTVMMPQQMISTPPVKKPRKSRKAGPEAAQIMPMAMAPPFPVVPPKKGRKVKETPVIEVEVVNGQNDIAYLPIAQVKDALKKSHYHPGVIDRMPEWYLRALLRDISRSSRNGPSILSGDAGDDENDVDNISDLDEFSA